MFTYLYLLVGLVVGMATMIKSSFVIGLYILGASVSSIIGSGGTILGLRSRDAAYRIGSPILGVALLAGAYWLSARFSIHIFDWHISGLAWTITGAVLGIYWGLSSKPLS